MPEPSASATRAESPAYSVNNFSYGSTPYTSWLKVVEAAGSALESALGQPGREYVVWGSSTGWLVLYGALTYGWRSRGVELLACLHEVAQQVAEQQAAALSGTGGVTFVCGDLLQDDVSRAGLVLLADQCWDRQLAEAAAAKLAAELPAGALCVSYSGTAIAAARSGREGPGSSSGAEAADAAAAGAAGEDADRAAPARMDGGGECTGAGGGSEREAGGEEGPAFELIGEVFVPVSWTEDQPFRLFRRR